MTMAIEDQFVKPKVQEQSEVSQSGWFYLPDGRVKAVYPANGKNFEHDQIFQLIDGNIATYEVGKSIRIYTDAQAKLKGLRPNMAATELRAELREDALDNYLYGPVLVVGDLSKETIYRHEYRIVVPVVTPDFRLVGSLFYVARKGDRLHIATQISMDSCYPFFKHSESLSKFIDQVKVSFQVGDVVRVVHQGTRYSVKLSERRDLAVTPHPVFENAYAAWLPEN